MDDRSGPPPGRLLCLTIGIVAGVVLLQLLPSLGATDFFREEGRRVIPAREMLESGDWVLPTIWGTPYLSKPPGMYWILAGTFQLLGGVSELAARLPSLLSTVLTALSILWIGRRLFGLRAGLFGGLIFALSVEVLGKGRLAEIEAPLALFVFLSVCLWWLGREGSWGWTIASGACLGAALLLKGPAALPFFLGPPLALSIARRAPRRFLGGKFLVPLVLGLALAAAWVVLLLGHPGYREAGNNWASEALARGQLAAYFGERVRFLLGTLFGFFPPSLVVLLAWRTPLWRELKAAPETAFAFWAAAAGWIFFALFPGTQVRYAYPVLPFLALFAGPLLDAGLEGARARVYAARLEGTTLVVAGLGVVIFLAAGVGLFVPLGEVEVDLAGLSLAAVVLGVSVAIFRSRDAKRRILFGFVLLPLLFGQISRSQVGAATTERHRRVHLAERLDATLPEGEPLNVGFWLNFNALLYVEHEVRFRPDWRRLKPGSWLLLTVEQYEELVRQGPEKPVVYEEIWRDQFWMGERVLVRVERNP